MDSLTLFHSLDFCRQLVRSDRSVLNLLLRLSKSHHDALIQCGFVKEIYPYYGLKFLVFIENFPPLEENDSMDLYHLLNKVGLPEIPFNPLFSSVKDLYTLQKFIDANPETFSFSWPIEISISMESGRFLKDKSLEDDQAECYWIFKEGVGVLVVQQHQDRRYLVAHSLGQFLSEILFLQADVVPTRWLQRLEKVTWPSWPNNTLYCRDFCMVCGGYYIKQFYDDLYPLTKAYYCNTCYRFRICGDCIDKIATIEPYHVEHSECPGTEVVLYRKEMLLMCCECQRILDDGNYYQCKHSQCEGLYCHSCFEDIQNRVIWHFSEHKFAHQSIIAECCNYCETGLDQNDTWYQGIHNDPRPDRKVVLCPECATQWNSGQLVDLPREAVHLMYKSSPDDVVALCSECKDRIFNLSQIRSCPQCQLTALCELCSFDHLHLTSSEDEMSLDSFEFDEDAYVSEEDSDYEGQQ